MVQTYKQHGAGLYGGTEYGGLSKIEESASVTTVVTHTVTPVTESVEYSETTQTTSAGSVESTRSIELPVVTGSTNNTYLVNDELVAIDETVSVPITEITSASDNSPVTDTVSVFPTATVSTTDSSPVNAVLSQYGEVSTRSPSSTSGSEYAFINNSASSGTFELADGAQADGSTLLIDGRATSTVTETTTTSESAQLTTLAEYRAGDSVPIAETPILQIEGNTKLGEGAPITDAPSTTEFVSSQLIATGSAAATVSTSSSSIDTQFSISSTGVASDSAFLKSTNRVALIDTANIYTAADSSVSSESIASDISTATESPVTKIDLFTSFSNILSVQERPSVTNSHTSQATTATAASELLQMSRPEPALVLDTAQSVTGSLKQRIPVSHTVGDLGLSVESTSITEQSSVPVLDKSIWIEYGSVVQNAEPVTKNDRATVYEPIQVVGVETLHAVGTAQTVEDGRSTVGSNSLLVKDDGIANGAPTSTRRINTSATESAEAQHVVGMSADVLILQTSPAHTTADASAKFSNPPDFRVGENGSSTESSSSMISRDLAVVDIGYANDPSEVYVSGWSLLGDDNGTVSELIDATGELKAQSPTTARSVMETDFVTEFDPDVADTGRAGEFNGVRSPVSLTRRGVGLTVDDTASVGETPRIDVGRSMGGRGYTNAFSQATQVTGLIHSVLEGTAGVQTEIVTQLITTADMMSAIASSSSVEAASSVSDSPADVGDTGVATDTKASVSETVTTSEDETASSSESVETGKAVGVDSTEESHVTEVVPEIHTGKAVLVSDSSQSTELVSLSVPEMFRSTERSVANSTALVSIDNFMGSDSIEGVPVTETLSVSQQKAVSGGGDTASVAPQLSITSPVEHGVSGRSTGFESGHILDDSIIESTTTIPGLRRVMNILGLIKRYIHNRDVGPRRSVVVGAESSESIEIGPVHDVSVINRSEFDITVSPERSIEINSNWTDRSE